MNLVDAIQQYQSIIFEVELGDSLVRLQDRKDLSRLGTFLTKELGSDALKRIMREAQQQANNHKRPTSA